MVSDNIAASFDALMKQVGSTSEREVFNETAAGSPTWDFEWFAADCDGRVAGLTNAGHGPIPSKAFTSYEIYKRTLDTVSALSINGHSIWLGDRPTWRNTWVKWSELGLYAYDWHSEERVYRQMSSPSEPISVSDFSSDIADYLRMTGFPEVSFTRAAKLEHPK